MAQFALRVDDDLDLVLREPWTDVPLHELVLKNLDRLRAWEPWAHGEQSLEGARAFARSQLLLWVDGACLPTAIRENGNIVGSLGARINTYTATADIGYWVDDDHVGRGIATRAAGALVSHLSSDRGVRRIEIRASVDNVRSRAVAERLTFAHEGTLRAALAVGERIDDVALYGRVFLDR